MVYQQPVGLPGGQCPLQPPTPFKTFENWNYCHTHGRDVNNTHTGMSCRNSGPLHNPNVMRTNMMGGNRAGLHRMILPSASGCVPSAPRQPQTPAPYNVAVTPTSREFYSDDGGNVSNDADNPLPGHQLHGPPARTSPSAVRTSPLCCRATCAPSRTACGNDDAVLQSICTASKLLTVRGK